MSLVPSVAALFTLTDFGAEGGVCIDSKGGHNGKYIAPSSGSFSGEPILSCVCCYNLQFFESNTYVIGMISHSVAGVNIALVDGTENRGSVTDEMRATSDLQGRERREKIKEGTLIKLTFHLTKHPHCYCSVKV